MISFASRPFHSKGLLSSAKWKDATSIHVLNSELGSVRNRSTYSKRTLTLNFSYTQKNNIYDMVEMLSTRSRWGQWLFLHRNRSCHGGHIVTRRLSGRGNLLTALPPKWVQLASWQSLRQQVHLVTEWTGGRTAANPLRMSRHDPIKPLNEGNASDCNGPGRHYVNTTRAAVKRWGWEAGRLGYHRRQLESLRFRADLFTDHLTSTR